MYEEVKFKSAEIDHLTTGGTATVIFYVEGEPSVDFAEWFMTPSNYETTQNLSPQMCTVMKDRIIVRFAESATPAGVTLVKGWIQKANQYARGKGLERKDEAKRTQEQRAELERRRRELQEKINKL